MKLKCSYHRCSQKSRNIHRETPVLESIFNKVAGHRPATLLKRDPSKGFFLYYFEKYLQMVTFESSSSSTCVYKCNFGQ